MSSSVNFLKRTRQDYEFTTIIDTWFRLTSKGYKMAIQLLVMQFGRLWLVEILTRFQNKTTLSSLDIGRISIGTD